MHKGSFSVYSATGLLTQISSSEYLVLLTSSEENRFNGTEISQQTEAEPVFYSSFSPWLAVTVTPKLYFLCVGVYLFAKIDFT